MKITAAGDAIIQKPIPEGDISYSRLTDFISKGDVRFFNLETTLFEKGQCCASQFSGGTYLRTSPKVLEDLKKYGFNSTSFNNNHCLDFSYDGFLKTQAAVDESGLINAGTGRSLAEATDAKYIKTPDGTAALLAFNTTFEPCAIAGATAPNVPGRPGVNGLQLEEYVEVTEEEFEHLKALSDKLGINDYLKITVAEGYYIVDWDKELPFAGTKFVRSDKNEYVQRIRKKDLDRAEKAIREAAKNADEVLISVHSHEMTGSLKDEAPTFLQDFARMCIDWGATAVIGHGPHLLRPIELYKGCPIFYSLGDFILQLYDVEYAPAEFYEKYGLTPDAGVHELLKTRSKNFTIGLMEQRVMFQTVIPYWERKNGKLTELCLLPVELEMKGDKATQGLPRLAEDASFMEHLAEISAPFGTEIINEKGIYRVKL